MKAAAAERRTAAPEERVTAGRPRLDRMVSVKDLLGRIVPRNVRAERLREMVRSWPLVVGAARARNSAPYDLVAGALLVAAKTPHAAQQLNQMKGNVRPQGAVGPGRPRGEGHAGSATLKARRIGPEARKARSGHRAPGGGGPALPQPVPSVPDAGGRAGPGSPQGLLHPALPPLLRRSGNRYIQGSPLRPSLR